MSRRTRIAISKLRSSKTSFEFRDSPGQTAGQSFFDLVKSIRNGRAIEAIEVMAKGEEYVILNGVRRAMAALAAGQAFIDAVVVDAAVAGKSGGQTVPLREVRFPYDLRPRF